MFTSIRNIDNPRAEDNRIADISFESVETFRSGAYGTETDASRIVGAFYGDGRVRNCRNLRRGQHRRSLWRQEDDDELNGAQVRRQAVAGGIGPDRICPVESPPPCVPHERARAPRRRAAARPAAAAGAVPIRKVEFFLRLSLS